MIKLYVNKKFYVRNSDDTLDGPREDIYYTNRQLYSLKERLIFTFKRLVGKDDTFHFARVTDGRLVEVFRKDRILVLRTRNDGSLEICK